MESVYIETSVVSYLVARPSREPVTAWRQQLTNEWWVARRGQFACVISHEVIAEALEGDAAGGEADGGVAEFAADCGWRGKRKACDRFAGARIIPRQRPGGRESSDRRDLRGSGLSADVELPASG